MPKNKKGYKRQFRTFVSGSRAHENGRKRDMAIARVLQEAVTLYGIASQSILQFIFSNIDIQKDEKGRLDSADLYLPWDTLSEGQKERAMGHISKPRKTPREKAGPAERAEPQFKNSFHMEELVETREGKFIRIRLAQAYEYKEKGGNIQRKIKDLDATHQFQGLIKSWFPIDWDGIGIPSILRAGCCQKTAQDCNSHLGLMASDLKASFPSLLDRDPQIREQQWRNSLESLLLSTHPFEYEKQRELSPGKYALEDKRGDRLVNIDPVWQDFVSRPFPSRRPALFVKQDDIVVYEWQPPGKSQKRLFAAVPILTRPPKGSPLIPLMEELKDDLFWWKKRVDEFTPLPLWKGKKLSARQNHILVQVETRDVDRLTGFLSGKDGRSACWAEICERRGGRGRRRNKRRWELSFVTAKYVERTVRPNVLGIHFGMEPILWWCLMDPDGNVLDKGSIEHNEILTEGLRRQLELQDDQKAQRWVEGHGYSKDLSRRTEDLAQTLILMAHEMDANLIMEGISHVPKKSPNHELNRRFSMWNYAELRKRIEAKGWEAIPPVPTLGSLRDYVLKFTCPECGACRDAKKESKKKDAKTWREGNILTCRKCGYNGTPSHEWQANLVAKDGVKKRKERLKRLEKSQEEEEE